MLAYNCTLRTTPQTPLHMAASSVAEEAMWMLIEFGASVTATDNDGKVCICVCACEYAYACMIM